MKRKLAAVLHADAVGYSRLSGQDEEQTHRQLTAGLNLLTDQVIAHGGSKINEAGDALLAEFSSVTEAVDTAVDFQKLMAAQIADFDKGQHIEFRIGVNVGEVIHDRDDIYGDGVNIAARIQGIAAPGSLCVSNAVLEQINSNTNYNFEDLGYRNFKNIKRPIHVYQLRISDLSDNYPMLNIESRIQGQPLFDDAFNKPMVTKGQCACGSIKFEVYQETLGTGACHCRICQLNSGAPVFAWAAFPTEAIRFTREKPKLFRLSLIAQKGFCNHCGTPVVAWQCLKPEPANYIVISTACLDNPEDYAPTWHGGVESQMPWLQIDDDLPRTQCLESPMLQKAWGSVGVTNPKDWVALEYEQAKELDKET